MSMTEYKIIEILLPPLPSIKLRVHYSMSKKTRRYGCFLEIIQHDT